MIKWTLPIHGGSHIKISQDFTYGDDYYQKWVEGDAGGPGLERHDFTHIDMPLTKVTMSKCTLCSQRPVCSKKRTTSFFLYELYNLNYLKPETIKSSSVGGWLLCVGQVY